MVRCKKLGISPTVETVSESINHVSALLLKGKADELGDFKLKSKTEQPNPCKFQANPPEYWEKISAFANSEHTGRCLVAAVQDDNSCIDYFKSDLLLNGKDFNECYFQKRLANCLVKERCAIYLMMTELSIRGRERLISLLRDCRKILDERCWIIIVSADEPPVFLKPLVDVVLKCDNPKALIKGKRQAAVAATSLLCNFSKKIKPSLDTNDTKSFMDSDANTLKLKIRELESSLDLKDRHIKSLEEEQKNIDEEKKGLETKCHELEIEVSELRETTVNADIQSQSRVSDFTQTVIQSRISVFTQTEAQSRVSVFTQTESQIRKHSYALLNLSASSPNIYVNFKKKIDEMENLYPNASPAEILHRSCRENLKYEVQFKWLKEKIFECSLKVLNECFGVHCNQIWKGQGLSKSKAKMSSFKELMDKLKEFNE